MISLIFPTYNEEGNLAELHRQLREATASIEGQLFEFIFVDDCSSDRTPEILRQLHEQDERVKIIRFARNCGSHAAISAGLNECRGAGAVVLAADLQDPPEIIGQLINEWKAGGKIVWGLRAGREGESFLTKALANLYYRVMNWLTIVKMPPKGADVFLADRVAIDAFKQFSEKYTSIFMTFAWLGFPQRNVEYVKAARYRGESKWTWGKKFKLALDSLLSFSDIPVRYMSVLGFITALLGFAYALFVFWKYVFFGVPVQGWSSLIIAILVVGGVQMTMLGVLGEYLWRTFEESRKRPVYVVEYKID
ncbi:MAG: glycosyltransferase [Candidatus Omnitrophica bacterium]|nr:glycosyltransferase [Candidatus Omnitrophota bacterium]